MKIVQGLPKKEAQSALLIASGFLLAAAPAGPKVSPRIFMASSHLAAGNCRLEECRDRYGVPVRRNIQFDAVGRFGAAGCDVLSHYRVEFEISHRTTT